MLLDVHCRYSPDNCTFACWAAHMYTQITNTLHCVVKYVIFVYHMNTKIGGFKCLLESTLISSLLEETECGALPDIRWPTVQILVVERYFSLVISLRVGYLKSASTSYGRPLVLQKSPSSFITHKNNKLICFSSSTHSL